MQIFYLDKNLLLFPPLEYSSPEGILAVGGDLSTERLLLAYSSGIFPWYSEGEPIIWWSPDPRFVLYPDQIKISKSMKKIVKNSPYHVSADQDFRGVISQCRKLREKDGTWITDEMLEAYCTLHEKGYAHSFEVWEENRLVGGLYGVSLGSAFFGESMFSKKSNTSKIALIKLAEKCREMGFLFIDSQVYTAHLASMGAFEIPRNQYIKKLEKALEYPTQKGNWGELLKLK